MKRLIFVLLLSNLFALDSVCQVYPNSGSTILGKLYYQSKSAKVPASYLRLIIMPNTANNLALASNLYDVFDENTIKKVSGARTTTTLNDGTYEIKNLPPGSYILRATGMGGMVIKFSVTPNTKTARIPDMPADYYNRKLPSEVYIKKN